MKKAFDKALLKNYKDERRISKANSSIVKAQKLLTTKTTIMKTVINLNFQMANKGERPNDMSMNRESIVIESLSNIPSVGDFVCFDNEEDVEVPFVVKTRLFEYSYNDNNDSWSINANVVVERQSEVLYNMLLKM